MKTNKLRIVIPLLILVVAGVGFAAHAGVGTLSAVGWEDVALLCPVGALTTMLASKTVLPRAVFSLVLAVIAIVILGRAFCAWICPVPVWGKLRTLFKRQPSADEAAVDESAGQTTGHGKAANVDAPLSAKEAKMLKTACGGSCHTADVPSNSRHLVLGGTLLSAAIFGFPVFCLICPIGLSFALVFVLIMLFGHGDVTWSVIAIPALLLVEVVFFRKWCSHICPLSALMSLVGKLNRTFRPAIDNEKCLETSRGAECGRCAQACEVRIDPRHPELGASWEECTKCRACVEACPAQAISIPLLPKKAAGAAAVGAAGEVVADEDAAIAGAADADVAAAVESSASSAEEREEK